MRLHERSCLLLLGLLLLSTLSLNAQERLPSLIKRIQPAIVTIIAYDAQGNVLAQGTGFFISKQGDLITNYHVIKGSSSAIIRTQAGSRYPAKKIVAEDENGDLVQLLVDVSGASVKTLLVTRAVPPVGERVIVIGSPLGLAQTVSDGIVSAVRNSRVGRLIQITAPISQGSSGSPVVNIRGEVVGVATLQFREGQNLNFAIPGQRVITLSRGLAAMAGGSLDHSIGNQVGKQRTKSKTVPRIDIGQFLQELGQKDLPKNLRAVRLHPEDAEAHNELGFTYYYLDRYEEAIACFKRALQLQPNHLSSLWMLGNILGSLGRYSESLEFCQQALHLKPEDANVLVFMSRAYAGLDRTDEAIEAAKKAIQINPDASDAHEQLGLIYLDLDRYEEAATAFEFSTRIATQYALGFYNLAWTYHALGRYQEAEAKYKEALEIDPKNEASYVGLGNLYSEIGQYRDAVTAFRQAVRIKPNNAKTYMLLGLCYLSLGDKASMLDVYKILKGIDADEAKKLFDLIYK